METAENILLSAFFEFSQEAAARLYCEGKRWLNGRYCPHGGHVETVKCKDHKPIAYRCKAGSKHFSVRTGTVLEESRLPLPKGLMAIDPLTTARQAIPATQRAKELGMTQKSAWFLAPRKRETWFEKRHVSGNKSAIKPQLQRRL